MTGRGPGFSPMLPSLRVPSQKTVPHRQYQFSVVEKRRQWTHCTFSNNAHSVPLWMNCLLCFFERSFFVVTTSATPESCAPCQFRKELVAQVSRSTVDDHLVDQSPFGALPEIECRLGAPKLKKSRRVSPRSSGLRSNLAQSLLRACLSAMKTTFDVICDSGRIRGTRLEFKVFFILPSNPLASSCVVWWHWELSAKIRTNTLCPDDVSNSFYMGPFLVHQSHTMEFCLNSGKGSTAVKKHVCRPRFPLLHQQATQHRQLVCNPMMHHRERCNQSFRQEFEHYFAV